MKLDSDHEKQVPAGIRPEALAFVVRYFAPGCCLLLILHCCLSAKVHCFRPMFPRRSTPPSLARRQCVPALKSARCCTSMPRFAFYVVVYYAKHPTAFACASCYIALCKIVNICRRYEEIISKLGPIFEKNISSSLAEIDFEREVGSNAAFLSRAALFLSMPVPFQPLPVPPFAKHSRAG